MLDIRYNGGGLLDIASEVAFMVAGAARTAGQTFEEQQFNSQYPSTNPVSGGAIMPTLFHSTSQGLHGCFGTGSAVLEPDQSIRTDQRRDLLRQRIHHERTAWRRGAGDRDRFHDLCKPYGFYPQDNCGTTYFSIEFRGVNAQGFGNYTDGFSPANTVNPAGVPIPGCSVTDDFNHALGDPNEGELSQALAYRSGGTCTVPPAAPPFRA